MRYLAVSIVAPPPRLTTTSAPEVARSSAADARFWRPPCGRTPSNVPTMLSPRTSRRSCICGPTDTVRPHTTNTRCAPIAATISGKPRCVSTPTTMRLRGLTCSNAAPTRVELLVLLTLNPYVTVRVRGRHPIDGQAKSSRAMFAARRPHIVLACMQRTANHPIPTTIASRPPEHAPTLLVHHHPSLRPGRAVHRTATGAPDMVPITAIATPRGSQVTSPAIPNGATRSAMAR